MPIVDATQSARDARPDLVAMLGEPDFDDCMVPDSIMPDTIPH